MATDLAVLDALLAQLPEVTRRDQGRYTSLSVRATGFGFIWPRTATVGLKQLRSEQLALVAERPDVFEVQATSGQFGWVVVHLDGVERDELAELVVEAWRLSAPAELVEAQGGQVPR